MPAVLPGKEGSEPVKAAMSKFGDAVYRIMSEKPSEVWTENGFFTFERVKE